MFLNCAIYLRPTFADGGLSLKRHLSLVSEHTLTRTYPYTHSHCSVDQTGVYCPYRQHYSEPVFTSDTDRCCGAFRKQDIHLTVECPCYNLVLCWSPAIQDKSSSHLSAEIH